MKRKASETLSEYLSEIDKNLLDNAYAIDDVEKLKKYKQKDLFARKAALRSALAAAACAVLILGVWLIGGKGRDVNIHVVPNQTQPSQAIQTIPT